MRALLLIVLTLVSLPAFSSYTKIANNGSDLPASAVLGSGATQWACTRDNATGLIWEVKTADGGLRDRNKTYTNYDNSYYNNYYPESQIDAASNGIGFAKAVRGGGLCGYSDWRIPTKDELLVLVDRSVVGYAPKIDPAFFPNTLVGDFWANSPSLNYPYFAFFVDFLAGYAYENNQSQTRYVRLVRGGQSINTYVLSVSAAGTGSGTVFAAGNTSGINCASADGTTSGACSTSLVIGTAVILTATPASGSTFTGWSGACGGTGATCTVTMDSAKLVTASFSSATPAPAPAPISSQTITFGAAPSVGVGQTGTLGASASSGLPVTFSSLTPQFCTVSGSTVSGVAAGTCTIAANQAGNGSTGSAPQATQSIDVTPMTAPAPSPVTYTLTVNSIGASSVAISASPPAYGWMTDYSTSGAAAGTSVTLTAPATAGSATFTNWSGCDSASGATCTLTINASRSVTALYASSALANQNITFGSAPNLAVGSTGAVSAWASSGLPVTFSSLTTGICSVSGSTVTVFAAGACTIAANQAGNGSTSAAPQVTQSFAVSASFTPATEYYHAGFGHYFVTGSPDEAAAIDSGAIKGWARTGQTYSVYSQGGAGLSPVCRFFTTSFSPKSSHFYTPSAAECGSVKTNPNWQFEGNAFYVNEPTGGACPAGSAPLYRIYNNGHSGAPNHRYTTCTSIRDNMVSRGWVSEGVAMCVPGGSANCTVDNSGGGVNYSGGTPIPPVVPLPVGYVVQGGLAWMPNAIPTVPQMYTYAQATALCAGTINGQTGWRLPTRNELSALYVSGAAYPRGDVMAMLQWPWVLSHNWSSTPYPYLAGLHYIVHLGSGNVDALYDSMSMLVTCVR